LRVIKNLNIKFKTFILLYQHVVHTEVSHNTLTSQLIV